MISFVFLYDLMKVQIGRYAYKSCIIGLPGALVEPKLKK